MISIAARIVGMHAQTLRQYERVGLVAPQRTSGRIRMYSRDDIARLRQVQRLMNDLGVNLAGVEVILRIEREDAGHGVGDGRDAPATPAPPRPPPPRAEERRMSRDSRPKHAAP